MCKFTIRSYDVVIVGSGIIGLMTAYKLAHYIVSVLVLEEKPVILTLEFKKTGRPMLVSLEGLDEELGTKLAEKYLWGLAVVRGIDERYSVGKPVDKSSLKNILRQLKPFDPIGLSPEGAHGLGIRFL
ncbi:MAG: FAD-dependent oxidoreductase, partial [Infirmifilum sp.]